MQKEKLGITGLYIHCICSTATFYNNIPRNLLLSLLVKEFLKIGQHLESQRQNRVVPFFSRHDVQLGLITVV